MKDQTALCSSYTAFSLGVTEIRNLEPNSYRCQLADVLKQHL